MSTLRRLALDVGVGTISIAEWFRPHAVRLLYDRAAPAGAVPTAPARLAPPLDEKPTAGAPPGETPAVAVEAPAAGTAIEPYGGGRECYGGVLRECHVMRSDFLHAASVVGAQLRHNMEVTRRDAALSQKTH
eukprot:96297-Prymnesium_polylepis.1